MSRVAFIVPFRDKGTDPCRGENALCVVDYLTALDLGDVIVADDGRAGTAPFNRSAAYNRGLQRQPDADVIVWHESDMIVPAAQLLAAIGYSITRPGLVIPFTDYYASSPEDARQIRAHRGIPADVVPAHVMPNGASIGAVGVTTRETIDAAGGWDEVFEGHAFDDNAMLRAFEVTSGPRRYIGGPAWHLWHIPGAGPTPGGADEAASDQEKAATEANRLRWERYLAAETPEEIRALTGEGR